MDVWVVLTGEYRASDFSYVEGVFLSLDSAKTFAEKLFNESVTGNEWTLLSDDGQWVDFEMGIALTYHNCYWYVLQQQAQP